MGGAAFVNDVRGQVWYNQTQAGLSFIDSFQHLNVAGLIDSTVKGAEFGFNLGTGFGAGALAQKFGFAGAKAIAAGLASDVILGASWDIAAHGDNLPTAFVANTLGFLAGEIAGKIINRAFKSMSHVFHRGGGYPYFMYVREVADPSMVNQELFMSCIPACVRQILRNEGIEVPESLLRDRLHFGEEIGVVTNQIPPVLDELHPSAKYILDTWDGDYETIKALLEEGKPVIAFASQHAVIIEAIDVSSQIITVRDPWGVLGPAISGTGSKGVIRLGQWEQYWRRGFFEFVTRLE